MEEYKKLTEILKGTYQFANVSYSLKLLPNQTQTIFCLIITLTNEQIYKINNIDNINTLKVQAEINAQYISPRFGASSKIIYDFSKNPIEIYGAPDAIVIFLMLIFNQ